MNELDQNNPNLWKWGIFYFNPKDPEALSSRNGLGRQGPAMNFAHFKTWLYIIGLIAAIVLLAIFK